MKFNSLQKIKDQQLQKKIEQFLAEKQKTTYSKYKIMKFLIKKQLWNEFKLWISNMQFQDFWDVPLEFQEDDEMFQTGVQAFKEKFGFSDDEMNTMKEECRN